ncbi:DUF1697 domain-containing protein [Cryobacterium tagatosivorans]|uniref:DUF1697 domain-containing protein n=1 Tax=Cryobacterium tagatosivorans TaxID=1259199 RepID=A0A4R8UJA2_9MICO|nr:DUF1697 domain-containing protein [Cryobacterium tagatosivorans]TFB55620.1 DUF1697 domain-containing protein [Cryobacterium tagatosivorans]
MTRYVALLRGINVNGITITMAPLADLFRELGYTGVKTVLASGNVLFDTDTGTDTEPDAAAIKSRIEAALSETFGYRAWIVLRDVETLARIARDYPFEADRDGWHPYVVFGSDDAVLAELAAAADGLDPADERVSAGDGVLYWEVRRAVGITSPFSKLSGKTRYRSSTTTRNLRTLHRLLG